MRNLKGIKFNRLIAIKFAYRKGSHYYWLFRCDCGKNKVIDKYSVSKGVTRSCGCLQKERARITGFKNISHGLSKSRFYQIWCCMKNRCELKVDVSYKNYGARGIKVCFQWTKFEKFKEDMYEDYKKHVKKYGEKNTSIDRLDNFKGYSKKNCKFSTRVEQNNNRRNNHFITYKNKTLTISEWAKKLGVKPSTFGQRIRNWPIKKAFTLPKQVNQFK